MRKIILDGRYMKNKEKAHDYLKKKLNICGYYGNNLDALWDAVSSTNEELNIDFINSEILSQQLEDYGESLIDVFKDAEDENENISFRIKPIFYRL